MALYSALIAQPAAADRLLSKLSRETQRKAKLMLAIVAMILLIQATYIFSPSPSPTDCSIKQGVDAAEAESSEAFRMASLFVVGIFTHYAVKLCSSLKFGAAVAMVAM